MEDKYLIAIIVMAVFEIFEKHDHNKKLDEYVPDDGRKDHVQMRDDLQCHYYIEGFFLIAAVIMLVVSLIRRLR